VPQLIYAFRTDHIVSNVPPCVRYHYGRKRPLDSTVATLKSPQVAPPNLLAPPPRAKPPLHCPPDQACRHDPAIRYRYLLRHETASPCFQTNRLVLRLIR